MNKGKQDLSLISFVTLVSLLPLTPRTLYQLPWLSGDKAAHQMSTSAGFSFMSWCVLYSSSFFSFLITIAEHKFHNFDSTIFLVVKTRPCWLSFFFPVPSVANSNLDYLVVLSLPMLSSMIWITIGQVKNKRDMLHRIEIIMLSLSLLFIEFVSL